jgi:hypothetical protein
VRRLLVPAALLALAGCGGHVSQARKEYAIVASRNPVDERALCDAAAKVQQAALSAQDDAAYKEWTVTTYNDCSSARHQ